MWNTLVITPLSTLLQFFLTHTGDIGLAIICFTLVIKIILFYFNISSYRTSKNIKKIQPEINKIKEKHKNDIRTQGLEMSKLYKDNQIKPFASLLNLFIQIPILFGLYRIIFSEIHNIGGDHITYFNIDVTKPYLLFAILTFISMVILMQITSKDMVVDENAGQFQKDFTKMMALQMKYVLPGVVFITSIFLPAGLTLYFIVSNIFAIGQTLLLRKIVK